MRITNWLGLVAAGVSILPVTVLMLVLSPSSGALAQRIGPRLQMSVGPAVCAAGLLLLLRVGADASYIADRYVERYAKEHGLEDSL